MLYHSHLDVGAYFSETDASAATMGGEAPKKEAPKPLASTSSAAAEILKKYQRRPRS